MIRALSTASTGMQAQQTKLDITANNVANVSTPGFKKVRGEFADLMYQTIRKPGTPTGAGMQSPTGLQVGMGVRTQSSQRIHSQGDLKQSGNPLDVAIEGAGYYPVNLPTGEVAFTRDGSFRLDGEGRVVTGEGYPLSGDLSIPAEATGISIASTGMVTVSIPGETDPVEVGQLEVATFMNESGLESLGRNLLRPTAASGEAQIGQPGENGAGTLAQGTLELSNVKVVEEMIELISGQRAYEVNTRVVRAADEMLSQTANLR